MKLGRNHRVKFYYYFFCILVFFPNRYRLEIFLIFENFFGKGFSKLVTKFKINFHKNILLNLDCRNISKHDAYSLLLFRDIESLNKMRVESIFQFKKSIPLDQINSRLSVVEELSKIAFKNELLPQNQQLVITGNAVKRLNYDKSALTIVQFFLPSCYFRNEENDFGKIRAELWEKVRIVFNQLYTELKSQNVQIWPINQHFLYKVHHNPKHISLSYHTYSISSLNSWNIKESPVTNYFLFDKGGYSGWSRLSNNNIVLDSCLNEISIEDMNTFFDDLHRRVNQKRVTKYKQIKLGKSVKLPSDYIFLALQVQTDMVSQFAMINGEELVNQLVSYSKQYSRPLVIKRHPLCEDVKIEKILSDLNLENVYISNNPIHELIESAKVVVTVNSGVGLESLIALKPVVCAGRSDYEYAVNLVSDKQQLFTCLSNIYSSEFKNDEIKVKKFLYLYFKKYLFHYEDKEKMNEYLIQLLSKSKNHKNKIWQKVNELF